MLQMTSQHPSKLHPRFGLEISRRMIRHLRRARNVADREDPEARRSRILSLLQFRARKRTLMKRLPLLPRLIEVRRSASVDPDARWTRPRMMPSQLSKIVEPGHRVARIATLKMMPVTRLRKELRADHSSAAVHPRTLTTLAERFLVMLMVPEKLLAASALATEATEEAEAKGLTSRTEVSEPSSRTEVSEPSSRAEVREAISRAEVREPSSRTELPTTVATATGTCLTTEEEMTTSSSLSMIGMKTAEILVVDATSMTSSQGQATTPPPEDQSDLKLALLCPPSTSHHREGTWGIRTTILLLSTTEPLSS